MTAQERDAVIAAKMLRDSGLTEAGIAGALGNFDAESNIVPCRMQGDFEAPEYPRSQHYAQQVMTGQITPQQWARDAIGFGLAQWTYGQRKLNLLDYCKGTGQFLGDLKPQVEFFIKECRNEYAGVWNTLTTSSDIRTCSNAVLLQYERPADMGIGAQIGRASRAEYWFNFLKTADDSEMPVEPEPVPVEPDTETTPYWPPRMLCKGMLGSDVMLLQAILNCRGYGLLIDGIFQEALDRKTRAFQKDAGIDVDGIVGPITWKALGVVA